MIIYSKKEKQYLDYSPLGKAILAGSSGDSWQSTRISSETILTVNELIENQKNNMKQVLQDLKTGKTILEDVPCPSNGYNSLLIQTTRTLVSAGTERMLVDFGKGNLIQKARQQPDKVKQVLEKVKTDGLMPTIDAVNNKLDTPLPLGYCNVGRVLESHSDGFMIWLAFFQSDNYRLHL